MQIGSWICLALMVSVRVLGYLITMSRKEAWWWWWWTCTRQNLFLSTTSFGCSSVSINMSFNTDVCCKRSLSYKGRRRWGINQRALRQSCRLCSQYLQWLHNFLNRKLQPDSTVLRIHALYFPPICSCLYWLWLCHRGAWLPFHEVPPSSREPPDVGLTNIQILLLKNLMVLC